MNWFKRNYLFVIGGTVGFAALLFIFSALAQPASPAGGPPEIDRDKAEALIAEKGGPGGCASHDECASFCDNLNNIETCLDYAQENDLMSYDDIQRARRFAETGLEGPGGCDSEENCRTYCDNPDSMEECLEFAIEHSLIPSDELEEASKVLRALRAGATPPGGCKNKQECEAYCDNPDHLDECVEFGLAAGFIDSEEAEMIKKTGGKGPGGCKGKKQCEAFCEDQTHFEECVNFAVQNGFMSAEEAEMAKKTGGKGPGGCKGKEECEEYCDNPDNAEECINFAVENGFMLAEEAEQAKKFMKAGGQGPGGCKGREECEEYCDNPDHGDECLEFGVRMGFIPPEEAEMAKKFMETGGPGGCKTREECEAFCQKPENQETCFNFATEQGFIKPEEAENMKRGMEMIEQGGPGGCKSEEECRSYCDNPDNQQECFNFVEDRGMIPPEQMQEMREQMQQMPSEGYPQPPEDYQPPPDFQGPPPEGYPQGPPPEGYPQPPENYYPQPPEGQFPPEYQQPPGEFQQPPSGPEYQTPPEYQVPPEYQAPPSETPPPPSEETSPPPTSFFQKGVVFILKLIKIFR